MVKKIATLLVALALILGVATPAFAESSVKQTTDKAVCFVFSPLLMVIKTIATFGKNVAERDKFDIPTAAGRGVLNGIGYPFEAFGALCSKEAPVVSLEENNVLADNDVVAFVAGLSVSLGTTSLVAATPIKYLQAKQLIPAIGVPIITSIVQDAND